MKKLLTALEDVAGDEEEFLNWETEKKKKKLID